MNTVIYLLCLINLMGIILLVFILESHSRLHKKINSLLALHKFIVDAFPHFLQCTSWNAGASYWQLWLLKIKFTKMQQQCAEQEEYEAASQCQRIIVNIDKLIDEYPSNDHNDNEK